MTLNPDTVSLDDVVEDIYAEICPADERIELPPDAACSWIAGLLPVYFVVDICYADNTFCKFMITERHLSRWGLSLEQLAKIVGEEGGQIPIEAWERVDNRGKVYRYPTFDRDWVAHLVSPRRLSGIDVLGVPVIMIPIPETFIVTGDNDRRGQTRMLNLCLELSDRPITPRPLKLMPTENEWTLLLDSQNFLAQRYARHFGKFPEGSKNDSSEGT